MPVSRETVSLTGLGLTFVVICVPAQSDIASLPSVPAGACRRLSIPPPARAAGRRHLTATPYKHHAPLELKPAL
jgi:hypothetical protein